MQEWNDTELLREYVEHGSEAAFAALVNRHLDKVYSVARRQVSHPHQAEEIAQAVFVILAQKARRLLAHPCLSGWLYQTAHLTAVTFLRSEIRRAHREREAMRFTPDETSDAETWRQLAPLLDHALTSLRAAERDAIVLRFLDGKEFKEVGAVLGASEAAAQKRVNRGLDKLRKFFLRRGVTLSAVTLAAALATHSVSAAPAGLATTIAATAASGGAVAGSTLTLIQGALKLMAWTKAKIVVTVGAVILATGTATVVVEQMVHSPPPAAGLAWADDPSNWALNEAVLNRLPSAFILRPTRFPERNGMIQSGDRTLGVNSSLRGLIAYAYGHNWYTMAVETQLPPGNFDFLMTPPYKPWAPLRDELRKRFGLVAHIEPRPADVLQLRRKLEVAPGLKPAGTDPGSNFSGPGEIRANRQPMTTLAACLQGYFGLPVTDHTGLTGQYDYTLKWPWHRDGRNPAERELIQQALLAQLGLELVPAREPVETLVVESVK